MRLDNIKLQYKVQKCETQLKQKVICVNLTLAISVLTNLTAGNLCVNNL